MRPRGGASTASAKQPGLGVTYRAPTAPGQARIPLGTPVQDAHVHHLGGRPPAVTQNPASSQAAASASIRLQPRPLQISASAPPGVKSPLFRSSAVPAAEQYSPRLPKNITSQFSEEPSAAAAVRGSAASGTIVGSGLRRLVAELPPSSAIDRSASRHTVALNELESKDANGTGAALWEQSGYSSSSSSRPPVGAGTFAAEMMHPGTLRIGASLSAPVMESSAPSRPFRSAPPFYWVQSVETISEFEVCGAFGEVVTKLGDFKDDNSALPIAGTLRMGKGGLYMWTIQIVKQCPHRPYLLFGIHGAAHAKPWRLVSTGRCSRSRDDGPWIARPGGDLLIRPGDFIHCEADLRGIDGPLGSFSFAINAGPFETVFEDIPLGDIIIHPVLCIGGSGTTVRLCDG